MLPERGPQWHPRYHIQTSGRSLHVQEIDFNDIRTTLVARTPSETTNSLHTNAYDEAITTPTEESVRRAMATGYHAVPRTDATGSDRSARQGARKGGYPEVADRRATQHGRTSTPARRGAATPRWRRNGVRCGARELIINKELGLAKNENPLQGSFIIEELTDLVEERACPGLRAGVLSEFDRITERGGVLGAMETMYQRSRIQEESLYYETLKHTGEYPIIGVNTFLSSKGSPTVLPKEVIRATEEEKEAQIKTVESVQKAYEAEGKAALRKLQEAAIKNENMFAVLMEATKYCSLGQLTDAMFEVGGQYRRNM